MASAAVTSTASTTTTTMSTASASAVSAAVASRVSLARTGFDAWALALLGGLSVAGGIGLLAAQRRGRLSA